MKKFIKIFVLLFIAVVVLPLASCSSQRPKYETITITETESPLVESLQKEGKVFVGFLVENSKNKQSILYLPGAELNKGEYELLYIDESKVVDGKYSLPEVLSKEGYTFAGWYTNSEYQNNSRIATSDQIKNANVLYARYLSFVDACIVALVCIIIVFLMLALLWFIVSLFKYLAPKEKQNDASTTKPIVQNTVVQKQAFSAADIKDEDMMVAAIVASIDYRAETKENVKVVSVKQIG